VPEDPRETALVRSMEGLIDAAWYLDSYPDVGAADLDPLRHFIQSGMAERRDPNPFFHTTWYTERYPDVSASGLHPLVHYLQTGAAQLRNPHPNFDAAWYAGQHPKAAANPLLYHLRTGRARRYPTEERPRSVPEDPRETEIALLIEGLIDADWYRARYPDVVAADLDPLRHFIRNGVDERRDPNPFFDTTWYIQRYPDVNASGLHPLIHYLTFGAGELRNPHPNFDAAWYAGQHPEAAANPLWYHLQIGRARSYPTEPPTSSPAPEDPREAALVGSMEGFIDAAWYRARYPDVPADLDPPRHFIRHGIGERRDPNPFFNGAWYTAHYPDVSASGMHPLLHYLQAGAAELRNPHPDFDAAWYAGQYPEAAANPLLYHLRTGRARGYRTEKTIDIADYLPSQRPPPRPRSKIVADVVIPVYKGLDETRRCLASVLASREKPLRDIIVVDDCSPEPDLSAYLDELASDGAIRLVRNKRNLGFVRSVNIGMAAAGHRDVVLLNSDAEVPAGWLRRLAAQAYAEPRIASVSPLSNNATICGYPDNSGHPILWGATLSQLDRLCQTVNAGRFVETPTSVGFCMYIRRDALTETGDFDAERFGLGYGEENDFCLRARELGWRHRIACDVFVYHKGSVSFGDRVRTLSKRAMTLLLERYPNYATDVASHVQRDAIGPFRFALTAALFRASGLPVILMVSHALGGGVRRHIDTLVERYHDTARVLLLEPTDRGAVLSAPNLPDHPVLALPADRLDDMVTILRSANLSRVHIHHLVAQRMDIRKLIVRLGVPFDVTIHDYYGICPQINLLPFRHGLYCNEPGHAACNTCISRRSNAPGREILIWRAELAWIFRDSARVLCPSLDVLARLQRHGVAGQAVFAPHEPVAPEPWPLRIVPPVDGKLRIAVIGTLVNHKGARTVASVAEIADPKTTEIHLIGDTDGPFPDAARKRMKITGRYDDKDLAGLIAGIAPHVIWFPVAWPETFSYTLSAAIEAGTAIAAPEIGAFPERLAGRPFTWLVNVVTSPADWIGVFETIRTALNGSRAVATAPLRAPVPDFYATQYLAPAASAVPPPRRPRIAIVPERYEIGYPTPCAYIRLLHPLHHPDIAADADIIVADAESIFDYDADVIVTQRHAIQSLKAANALAAHARRSGARLIFDLDDDLVNIPITHQDAWLFRPRAKVVRRMLELADTVWVSTQGLADSLAPIRPDAILLANRLDERIWTHEAAVESVSDEPVRILCMGTTTHGDDFAMLLPALMRLKAEFGGRVAIDILGMTAKASLPPELNRIEPSEHAGLSYPGFVDWLTRYRPCWHIGLAPLLDTPFNRGKSAIKAMDYAALGLVVLASDMPVFRGSIADGPAGWLVPNTEPGWYAGLDRLMRDRDLRRTLGVQSREAFTEHATLAGQAGTWRDALLRALRRDTLPRTPERDTLPRAPGRDTLPRAPGRDALPARQARTVA
jgi:GT2 family glycosyltransferase/glycosyltransferase involved in cell wall biosynthesis